jgi:hypothetical protein
MLTNAGVWSPDGEWIVYDVRSTADGGRFDGAAIERVGVDSGRVERIYSAEHGACCGVVTASPVDDAVVFILGPEHPTPQWQYGPAHRQGMVVHASRPEKALPLDARDLVPPFTAGALRGGTHVHVYSPDGRLVSSTYEDALLPDEPAGELLRWHASGSDPAESPATQHNRRCVAVSVCGEAVRVPAAHPRNHDGTAFSVVVTELHDRPRPGSDEIFRACEEAWIGARGYRRADGLWQHLALAFQGELLPAVGSHPGPISEVFVVDLPAEPAALLLPGERPLEGTLWQRPAPPRGVQQRRITFTAERKYPGLAGPRHWLRSSPDGSRIGCLMRDEAGIVQLFSVSPSGGAIEQITRGGHSVSSAWTWSPDGSRIAYVASGSVWVVEVASGASIALTPAAVGSGAPRPEACVFSPDGRRIAFMRQQPTSAGLHNQIFCVDVDT